MEWAHETNNHCPVATIVVKSPHPKTHTFCPEFCSKLHNSWGRGFFVFHCKNRHIYFEEGNGGCLQDKCFQYMSSAALSSLQKLSLLIQVNSLNDLAVTLWHISVFQHQTVSSPELSSLQLFLCPISAYNLHAKLSFCPINAEMQCMDKQERLLQDYYSGKIL